MENFTQEETIGIIRSIIYGLSEVKGRFNSSELFNFFVWFLAVIFSIKNIEKFEKIFNFLGRLFIYLKDNRTMQEMRDDMNEAIKRNTEAMSDMSQKYDALYFENQRLKKELEERDNIILKCRKEHDNNY